MRSVSLVLTGLGGFFLVMEVVYGYVFHVWHELAMFLGGKDTFPPTKTGEVVLFAVLAIGLPLLACPLALLARRDVVRSAP